MMMNTLKNKEVRNEREYFFEKNFIDKMMVWLDYCSNFEFFNFQSENSPIIIYYLFLYMI